MNSFAKALKNKIVDKASDVLSAPARAYYGVKSARSNMDANTLKKARAYDNSPSDEARNYRAAAAAIKKRYK